MSFSADVKEELTRHMNSARHCRIAELAAIMHFSGQYGETGDGGLIIGFQTDNQAVIKKGFTLWKKTYNIETVTTLYGDEKRDILTKFGDLSDPVNPVLLKNSCCKRAFLRGAYLCIGSMSDPEKSYHLEFVCVRLAQAMQLQEVLADFEVDAKIVRRKKYYVVYVKEGSCIVDLLGVMEAHVSLMNFENLRILKEMRNSINRRVNCEAANITKTVNAATKQVEDIMLIRDRGGLGQLPDNLREMAEVRLEYPDATLKELGEYLNPSVGKSGVNHRLRKLSEIAEKMRT